MHELVNRILHGIWGVWRFRWLALVLAWTIAMLGWIVVHKLDHKYYSSARLYIDTNQVLEPLLNGLAIQPDVRQRVALISRTLLSRPNLEHLIMNSNLDLVNKQRVDNEKLISDLQDDLTIYDATGSQSIYTIGYAHTDPKIAKQLVHSLIDIFVDSNLGQEREDNAAANRFLDDRIRDYESRLTAAEKRLADFKRQNAGSMPGESGGYYQRIEVAESQLRTASLELREVQNRRNELQRQLDSEEPVLINRDPNWVSSDVLRIQALQDQLDNILVKYTDRHPQVAQLRQSIAYLEAARESPVSAGRGVVSQPTSRVPSVVNQKLRTMLAESEARVAELQVRVSYYQDELNDLKATVDSIPQVEEKLIQLDRDYKTVRTQHETLLERRETARLTEAVKTNSDNVKFRVIDPPYVQPRPLVPNKKLLNVAVLGLALAAGTGISLFLALLLPVFFDKQSLATSTNLPVIGGITLHRSRMSKAMSVAEVSAFTALLALLIVIVVGLLIAETRNLNMAELLSSLPVPVLGDMIQSDIYKKIVDSDIFNMLTGLVERIL